MYNLLPVYTTCPVCVNSHVNCVLRCVIMDGDYFGVYVKMLLWLQIVVVSKLCFQKYLSARGPGLRSPRGTGTVHARNWWWTKAAEPGRKANVAITLIKVGN